MALSLLLVGAVAAESRPGEEVWKPAYRIDVQDAQVVRAQLFDGGRRILVSTSDRRARVLDSGTGDVIAKLGDGVNSQAHRYVADPSGSFAYPELWPAWGIADTERPTAAAGALPLWSLETGECIRRLDLDGDIARGPVGVSPDGKRLWCWTTTEERIHEATTLMVFDVASGKQLHSVAAAPGVLAPSGKCLLSWAGALRRGRVVELDDGGTRSLHGLAWGRNVATAFHPDRRRVALVSRVSSSRDPTVQVQVLGSGDEWPQPLSSFELSYSQLDAGSFSPDLESLLARTQAGHFECRDATTGETRWTHVPVSREDARLHCNYPTPPLYSADGTKAALWWADFSEAAGDHVASVTIVETSAGAARAVIQLPAGTPQLEDWSDAAGVLIATGPQEPPVVLRRR